MLKEMLEKSVKNRYVLKISVKRKCGTEVKFQKQATQVQYQSFLMASSDVSSWQNVYFEVDMST